MNKKKDLPRRDFIKRSITGLAGIAAVPSLMSGSNKSLIKGKKDVNFVYKDLGKTGIKLPITCLNGSSSDYSLFRSILDIGKTFVFTAPYYSAGKHEIEVGKVLKGINRDKYTLATGIGLKRDRFGYIYPKDAAKLPELLDGSLKRIGVDRVDVYFLCFASEKNVIQNEGILKSLEKIKKSGKAKHIAIATHGNEAEAIKSAVDAKIYDIVMAQYNFIHPDRKRISEAFEYASKNGVGTLVMKSHAGKFWDKERTKPINTKAAIKWALQDKYVDSVIYRVKSIDEMYDTFTIMENPELTKKEKQDLKLGNELGYNGLFCPQCGRCKDQCKNNLDIPTLMRSYMYAYGYCEPAFAKETIESISTPENLCNDCNICKIKCTMGFDIRSKINDIIRIRDVPEDFLLS